MRQVYLHVDPQDGQWIAEVPSLPGCLSQGRTREEALRNIREAIEQWLGAATEVGMAVPPEGFDAQICVI